MRAWALILLVLSACGDRGSRPTSPPPDGATPPTDGAVTADSSRSRDAGAGSDAAASDATVPDGDGGTPAGCGADAVDPLSRVPRSCRDQPECYDHPLCVSALLEADDRGDYTECGDPMTFGPGESDEVCSFGPPFGDWPTEFMCGRVSYEGTVRFFCSPDGATVLLRISGTASSVAAGEYFTHYGHDYGSGSGGGSGYAYGLSTPIEGGSGDRFVDLEPIARMEDGEGGWYAVSGSVYFIAGGVIDMSYFIGGGVQVMYPASP